MTVIQSQSSQDHLALKLMIRGTGVFIALGSAFLGVGALALLVTRGIHHAALSWYVAIPVGAIMTAIFSLFFKLGFGMFRKVDAAAVQNFSFIFALLSAQAFYHVTTWAGVLLKGSPSPLPPRPDFLYLLAFVSFFFFKSIYTTALLGALELYPPNSSLPSDPDGDVSSIPEFPQKSPLIELR